MTMSLRDLCLVTLRDSGIPLQVADRLTSGRRFDQSSQVLRLVIEEMWSTYKQEVLRGRTSFTNEGMDSHLLDILQVIRNHYKRNSPAIFEAPGAMQAALYEEPMERPSSAAWGYENTQ